MIIVDEINCEFNGDISRIHTEVAIVIYSYALAMQQDVKLNDDILMEDMLEYMKEIQYIVGCVSRGENLTEKLSQMIDYMIS